MLKDDALTNKQKLFCIYYLQRYNATWAYQQAYGVSYEIAMPSESRLSRNDKIKSHLAELKKQRAQDLYLTANDMYVQQAMSNVINEIGSTYTVQGFDLNYVGVELGPSVKYRDGKIIHDPKHSQNSKATQKRNSTQSYADTLLRNEPNVLLTRGVHGFYLHAVDPKLQKALEEAMG